MAARAALGPLRVPAALLGLILALGASTAVLALPGPAVAPGDAAPLLVAHPIGEAEAVTRVRWDDATVTVVNFWATWCEPCRQEMPALEAMRKERSGAGLAIYGVLLDTATDEVATKFVADLGIGYPVLRGYIELSDHWGGIGLMPTTFLVDAKGVVRRRYVGATPETIERMKHDLARLLDSAAPRKAEPSATASPKTEPASEPEK